MLVGPQDVYAHIPDLQLSSPLWASKYLNMRPLGQITSQYIKCSSQKQQSFSPFLQAFLYLTNQFNVHLTPQNWGHAVWHFLQLLSIKASTPASCKYLLSDFLPNWCRNTSRVLPLTLPLHLIEQVPIIGSPASKLLHDPWSPWNRQLGQCTCTPWPLSCYISLKYICKKYKPEAYCILVLCMSNHITPLLNNYSLRSHL